jgi:fibronectin type 3 domain-containing protein
VGDPVIAVGGDIACPPGKTVDASHCGQGRTGAVVTAMDPDYVIPLGDSQYDTGSPAEYAGSYDPTGWGAAKAISRPAAGNHEYRTSGATGYYGYFGTNAGDPQKGYYSWDVPVPNAAPWHMIALNSECTVLGGGSISAGCGATSSQDAWLESDLAAHKSQCTIAYWHRPRFSSSTTTPSSTTYNAFWNDLYAAGADLVLNGHAHDYERFAPQTSAGVLDPKGITEFIVGTGGEDFQTLGPGIANSAVSSASAFGALKLTLHASSYDYEFVPAAGYTLSDAASDIPCHNAPATDTTPPTAATNLSATASTANQVNLSWTAATDNVGVKNYNIYRGSGGATPTLLQTTTTNATTFTDTTVSASTAYTYQVEAQDAVGKVGPLSNAATVTTPGTTDTTPPTAPSGLAAEEVFWNEIDLGWNGSTDAGTGVSGYKVYRKGPGEAAFTLLATQPGTGAGHNSYLDTTVKPSSAYQYFVTAFDGASLESGASNTVSTSTPSGPTSKSFSFLTTADATIQQANLTATGGSLTTVTADNSPVNDAMLKFNVATPGCETLTSAQLSLTDSDASAKGGDFYTTGSDWTEAAVSWGNAPTRGALLNSLGAVTAGATVSVDVTGGVSLNGQANFRIGTTSSDSVKYFSREGAGAKPTLTVVCATTAPVPDATAPTAPTGLTASAGTSGEIGLAWGASADNVAVSGYKVYRDGGTTPIGSVPASSLTYQDTTVTAGTSYSYTVKAYDAANNESANSNSARATAPTAPPPAPANLQGSASGSTVNLTWTASSGASVTGYNIYRGPHGGALAKLPTSAANSPYQDLSVPAGSYDYAVTAVTTGGGAESAKTAVVNVVVAGATAGITAKPGKATTVPTAATSWTVGLPSFAPDDTMVVWLGNSTGSTAGTPAATGWTSQVSVNESSGLKGTFLTRRMVAGDATTATVTWATATSGVAEAAPFTGVSATTPVEVKGGAAEASATAVTSHSTPTVTTVTSGDVLVSGFTTDNASTWTGAASELADAAVPGAGAALYASAPVAAGSQTRTATATTGSAKAVSALLALRP